MQVSFIIPLYNCLAHTRECLRTLQATLPAGLTHEIILVDDGSTDGTREWLSTLQTPCRAILNDTNLGFAGACNRGATAATGELLFFLNNDLVLLPGWFQPMRRVFRLFRKVGLVGNVQRNAVTGAVDHAGIAFDLKCKPVHDLRRPLWSRLVGYRRVPGVTGACFGIRRRVWLELGAFDEGYRNGSEDVDLAFRARQAGYCNFVSLRSAVRHHISQSLGRKTRDESNAQRLMLRWRDEIGILSSPLWSHKYLEKHWEEPRNFDDRLARSALRHWLWPNTQPPGKILADTHAAIEVELERWDDLLGKS